MAVDLELISETLCARQEYIQDGTLVHVHTIAHSFTSRGNLDSPDMFFVRLEETGESGETYEDSNLNSELNWEPGAER